MSEFNCYQDRARAEAYDKLEFGGTYHLAFRDLPGIIRAEVHGERALDFGCGTGRSTRFLKGLGLRTKGVDIAPEMLERARARDPRGDYRSIADGDLGPFDADAFDLVLSAFTFDNIPLWETKVRLFREIGRVLKPEGRFINLVSSPQIYIREWASFSTKDFPENRKAKSGDVVRIITTDFEDRRPCHDILFTDECYQQAYQEARLDLVETRKPVAIGTEPIVWISEMKVAPWVIYVLKRSALPARP